jgi:hypothetical protein
MLAAGELDMNVALEVSDHFAGPAAERFGPINPQHRFVAASRGCALRDSDLATEHPNLVAALPPMRGAAGADGNRLIGFTDGQLDGGPRGGDETRE